MDNDTRNFFGCIGLIVIGLLVWIGIRASSVGQFFAYGGILIAGIIFAMVALVGWVTEGAGYKMIGLVFSVLTILALVSVGRFLFTGNYAGGLRVLQPWNWNKPLSEQVAEAPEGEKAASEPTAVATATRAPTATAETQATETPLPTFTPMAAAEQPADIQSPAGGERAYGQVTDSLNQIWKMSQAQASQTATQLRQQAMSLSGEAQYANLLLTAAAHQRAGELGSAKDFYQKVIEDAPDTPYAATANVQAAFMEIDEDDLKTQIKKLRDIFGKPAEQGWFLVSDVWEFMPSRTAAAKELISLQSDQLSFRFFNMIYERSIFPPEYSYLFIFLVVLLVAKLVTLPLSFRAQQMAVQLRGLQPEIDWINRVYSGDEVEKNKRLMELYQRSGINYWSGCAVALIDLVFVIWVFLTVRSFSPQFYLDEARFWVADDITVFSLQIIFAWIAVMVFQAIITYLSQPKTATVLQAGCGTLLIFGIIAGVAYYYKTPAYGFILYAILALSSLLISLILLPIAYMTARR
jgi:membrane protein insertase Oxa1/YidC/SpoIIIJ